MTDRISFAGKVEAEGRRLRGSVVLTGSRTFRNGEWLEVDPAALVRADASSVVATVDHDPKLVVGHTRNQTLTITRDEHGIAFETGELPNTTAANDALELARGGYFGGSSFAIEGLRSDFYADPDTGERVRRITSIKRLADVSVVMDPAFENSTAAAFSKESDVTEPIVEKGPESVPTPEAPKVQLSTPKDDLYTATREYARRLPDEQLSRALEGAWAEAGDKPDNVDLERIRAITDEFNDRREAVKMQDDDARRLRYTRDALLNRMPKAPEAGLLESDDYHHAFSRYIRHGDLKVMEQFAQSISGTGAEGGYTVPTEFRQKIVETQAAFGGIQQLADVIETGDGRTLPWPTNNDTGNSAVVASEGSAPGSAGADLVFGEVSLGAFSIAASGASNAPLKVSWELIQDSAFDIEAFVAKKLGERLGRKAAAYYATGVGTTEPFGALAKTPDTMTATKVRAATVEHIFQVNEAYRNSGEAGFVMSDTILARVWNSVDLNGRPLFIPSQSPAERVAGTLYGFPVRLDQGAGTLVAFGDLRQGYVIRRVRDIQVVVDPYNNTATRQTAYHAWMRTDAAVQDSAAYSVSDWTSVTADATA